MGSLEPASALSAMISVRCPGVLPDIRLVEVAVTHRSYSSSSDNERLEFLGDAVLDLAVASALLQAHPAAPEGELSRLRAGMVREATLAGLARGIGLGAFLRMGRGEDASGGREKDSLLADALEALVGAVFVSCGYAAAETFVLSLLDEYISGARPVLQDAKTLLQERAAASRMPPPSYMTSSSGSAHAPRFFSEVLLADGRSASGEGRTRKSAEQQAASRLLEMLA